MADTNTKIRCEIKTYRRRKGLSQDDLAQLVGLRRQAVYDIESGRYLPNTAIALKLARVLGCTVEMLFVESTPAVVNKVHLLGTSEGPTRLSLAQVRDKYVGIPLGKGQAMPFKLETADGFLGADKAVDCHTSQESLARTVLIAGCDPALSLLGGLMERAAPGLRHLTAFVSSQQALFSIQKGHAHVAGIHYHSFGSLDGNLEAVSTLLPDMDCSLIAFSLQEEGLMVAVGNPLGISSIEDVANKKTRFVNREPGAALRGLFDGQLEKSGAAHSDVTGYADEVYSHSEGAMRIVSGLADAALGLRIVAESFGLGFVPLAVTRCDLVIPSDLLEHPGVTVLLDTLQTAGIRKELCALSGYDSSATGKVIAGTLA